jgi:hypothetical protein
MSGQLAIAIPMPPAASSSARIGVSKEIILEVTLHISIALSQEARFQMAEQANPESEAFASLARACPEG